MTRHIAGQVRIHAEEKGFSKVIMWSDGCAAQYKSKLPFYFAAQSSLEWVFFGSRHGKSACDGCGGVVKTLCDEDVRNGAIIQNAQQMFDHLMENHCLPENPPSDSECCHNRRSFRMIDEVERSMSSSALNTVPGTRKIHHITGQGDNTLLTRNFACFCNTCLGISDAVCPSSHVVNNWQETSITFSKTAAGPFGKASTPAAPPPESNPNPPPPESNPNPLPPEPASREGAFKTVQQEMCAASTYDELYSVIESNMEIIQHYQVTAAPSLHVTDIPSAQIDAQSLALRPGDVPWDLYPICIYGDGNCFPRTLSVLAFGRPDHHTEMRVRIVAELVLNYNIYLSTSYLAQGSTADGNLLLRLLLQDVDIADRSSLSPFEIFQSEILAIRRPGTDVNMWAVYAAANILQVPIMSVYPDKGEQEKQLLAKRTIVPFEKTSRPSCFIMWTTNRDDMVPEWWKANHFVPLLPMHPAEEPSVQVHDELKTAFLDGSAAPLADNLDSFPATDDFFLLRWQDNRDYVCQVAEMDMQQLEVLVNFMCQQDDSFYWGSRPDSSWETLDCFLANSKKVSMRLNEDLSTQRRVLFDIER
ncbi:uncharacterized protein [Littorina saxatilis]|uniref:uncharacterized protein n=1 Tax=Littorina saxatilis TaxID=31220 RepID=UPI0038B5BF31